MLLGDSGVRVDATRIDSAVAVIQMNRRTHGDRQQYFERVNRVYYEIYIPVLIDLGNMIGVERSAVGTISYISKCGREEIFLVDAVPNASESESEVMKFFGNQETLQPWNKAWEFDTWTKVSCLKFRNSL